MKVLNKISEMAGRYRAAARGAERAAAYSRLLDWGRHYLPAHFQRPSSMMHQWLESALAVCSQSRGGRVNLIGPRGHAKSTVATLAYVLKCAVEASEPYIWIVSDTKEQAQLHLENVKRELADNEQLAEDYPLSVGKGRRWQRQAIELANGVVIEAWGTGQSIRGRRRREHRPTLIVCDDLQNDSHISSAQQRQTTRQWFHGTLLKAGTAATNVLNLATALHRQALAVELDSSPGWTARRFAAIVSWPTNIDRWTEWESIYCDVENPHARNAARQFFDDHRAEMEAGAVVLWPEEEDLYTLMRMRVESGHTAFEREKQGAPLDPELCEWPESYFENDIWFDCWPDALVVKAIALDPSKGHDARRGDYSAFVLLGVDAAGVIYVEADLARRPTPQIVADGVELYRRFRPTIFGVEANQFQELLAGEIEAEFQRRAMPLVALAAIHNTLNKAVRIRSLAPYLSKRRFRFLSGSPSTRLLVDQLRDFPAGAHDDGPDALEMALRLAQDALDGGGRNDGLGDRLIDD